MSNPLLVLLSFCSFAVLILTVSLSMLIGDGSHAMSDAGATALGAAILLANASFLGVLVIISIKHLRALVAEGFLKAEGKAAAYVKRISESSSRSLRRMASSLRSSGLFKSKVVAALAAVQQQRQQQRACAAAAAVQATDGGGAAGGLAAGDADRSSASSVSSWLASARTSAGGLTLAQVAAAAAVRRSRAGSSGRHSSSGAANEEEAATRL
eukprot:357835-Chlamydomonas_euryale.AAC.2